MELSSLEAKFFDEILNAELDVPVQATLTYKDDSLELIVVPEINSRESSLYVRVACTRTIPLN